VFFVLFVCAWAFAQKRVFSVYDQLSKKHAKTAKRDFYVLLLRCFLRNNKQNKSNFLQDVKPPSCSFLDASIFLWHCLPKKNSTIKHSTTSFLEYFENMLVGA